MRGRFIRRSRKRPLLSFTITLSTSRTGSGARLLTVLLEVQVLCRELSCDTLPLGVVGSAAHSECEGARFETWRGIQFSWWRSR
jgi:hypothetical protein